MTLKQAYATLWKNLPGAHLIKIFIETAAKRNKPAEVEYSLHVYTDTGGFHMSRVPLAEGVAEMIRKIKGKEPVPADLDVIQDQVSEL